MVHIVKLIIAVLLLFTFSIEAKEKHTNELELLTGLPKPPFILNDLSSGLQLDLITEVFSSQNIKVSYSPMPLGRNITGFQTSNVDGVITIPPDYKYPGMFISQPYVTYQNVAVSLAERNIDLEKVKDLSSYSMIAFQNAKKFLGEDFADVAAYSVEYRELASQKQQIEMLFAHRVEVIILDINIFKYYMRESAGNNSNIAFDVHYLFPERHYSMGFKKQMHMDKFNQGLDSIRANGVYQTVLDNYLSNN